MTGNSNIDTTTVVAAAVKGENMELVRGQEEKFLKRMTPVVQRQSVSLDLDSVERIDAAGLAVLITLYCDASKAGHSFRVARPRRHVREILSVVGLDRLLLAGEDEGGRATHLGQNAA
jgi:anti-anti-sigma factor